jgi:hypothetical protein
MIQVLMRVGEYTSCRIGAARVKTMIQLEFEMTYRETIDGPMPSTKGSPLGERLCWKVETASLTGPRINATLAMPGMDWIRLGSDGIRRQDLRAPLITEDGVTILLQYHSALIRSTEVFLNALAEGKETDWADQYMRMVPEFMVGEGGYRWLEQSLFLAEGRLAGKKQIEYRIYRVV